MSSSKGVMKTPSSLAKQKASAESTSPTVNEVNEGVGDMDLNSAQDGGWEVCSRKSKNKGGSSAGIQRVPQNHNHKACGKQNTKAWGHSDVQKVGMLKDFGSGRGSGNNWSTPNDPRKQGAGENLRQQLHHRGFGSNYTPPAAVPPVLKSGWDWSARATSAHPQEIQVTTPVTEDVKTPDHADDDNESDILDGSDDELLSDDFDSDVAEMSYEERKKSRWFKELFECLEKLTVAEINDPARQWHCPACKGGPGAIEWFTGLLSLVAHAKTKGVRVKLHRELAELLEVELRQRGTSVVPPSEMYRRWGGIEFKDKEIVWPPMVVIMNTRHDKDENDKWIGMGNQELLNYFSSYAVIKARHSYGPQGHRGMSVLIFEASAVGYIEAERLSEHFSDNGRNRDAWERHPIRFNPGGQRQLYGYIAEKRDIDSFNQHSPGKSRLKFEMRSYVESVLNPAKQMREDNQLLLWFKNKATKHQMHAKALEESLTLVSEKHRQILEENKIVRLKTKMHHEQVKEEMEYQEQFFNDQIKVIYDARNVEEDKFEMKQQEWREMVKEANANTTSVEDHRQRAEKVAKFIKLQDKEMDKFVEEREILIKIHDDRIAAMRRRYWEEKVELEKKFDLELATLMEKYSPKQSQQVNSNPDSINGIQTPS